VGVLVPSRKVRLLGWWFVTTLAIFVLQGGVLSPDSPAVRLAVYRYWIAFVVPGALAAAAVLTWAARRVADRGPRALRPVLAAVAVVALAVPVVGTGRELATNTLRAPSGGLVFASVREWLHEHPPSPGARVWTDYYGARVLRTYSRNDFGGQAWQAPVRSVYAKDVTRAPGDLVVFIDRGCAPCTQYLGTFRKNRPNEIATWQVLYRAPDGAFTVYRVP
jgi:hypothetical protein